ncbi:MAG: 30S ribosomal protein S4 [bacterium]|nr:30S ribosomal protein S4 [bacterium]
MIRQPKYKVCRRLGDRIFAKCQTPKYAVRAARKAGNVKRGRGRNRSDYGTQLLEKQKVRFTYGLSERQFRNYVKYAREKGGQNASLMLSTLVERRLDNTVFRLGLVNSRPFGRQVVSHGHVRVNGRKINIPSYQVKIGDVISIREGSANNAIFTAARERGDGKDAPRWLSADAKTLEGKVIALPGEEDIIDGLNYAVVVEFYSR